MAPLMGQDGERELSGSGGVLSPLFLRMLKVSHCSLFEGPKVKIAPICVLTEAFFKDFSGKGRMKKKIIIKRQI